MPSTLSVIRTSSTIRTRFPAALKPEVLPTVMKVWCGRTPTPINSVRARRKPVRIVYDVRMTTLIGIAAIQWPTPGVKHCAAMSPT